MNGQANQAVLGTDDEYYFDYDLCLVGLAAVSFYEENKHRLNEVTLNEYSSHAINLIDRITEQGYDDDDLDITSEMIDITTAALRAKGNIAHARHTIEAEDNKSKVARLNGGVWWFYKQVVAHSLDTVWVSGNEHKKIRPTQDIYDHLVDVSFTLGDRVWVYKAHIREHKEIKIVGSIKGERIAEYDIKTPEGGVYFLFNKIARVMALDKSLQHIDYMAKESPAAKRAVAIAKLLKGDYKSSAPEKTAFDELKISDD